MISNIMSCYKQNFNNISSLYVEMRNQCPIYISFLISYMFKGKRIRKPSKIIPPGKAGLLLFQDGTTSLNFTLYDCSYNPAFIVLIQNISSDVSSCFNVTKNPSGAILCIPTHC